MGGATKYGRALRATLCEVERGVFYATYTDCASGSEVGELTSFQIGASAADAKQMIEISAHALGFHTVTWTETISVPVFASPVKAAFRQSLHTFAPRSRA